MGEDVAADAEEEVAAIAGEHATNVVVIENEAADAIAAVIVVEGAVAAMTNIVITITTATTITAIITANILGNRLRSHGASAERNVRPSMSSSLLNMLANFGR